MSPKHFRPTPPAGSAQNDAAGDVGNNTGADRSAAPRKWRRVLAPVLLFALTLTAAGALGFLTGGGTTGGTAGDVTSEPAATATAPAAAPATPAQSEQTATPPAQAFAANAGSDAAGSDAADTAARAAVLARIPEGAFRAQLLALDPVSRARALDTLAVFPAPASDYGESLHIGPGGGLFHVCELGSATGGARTARANALGADAVSAARVRAAGAPAAAPTATPPALHSRLGAANKVVLDFGGGTVTGTVWNLSDGFAVIEAKPFSLDSDFATFSDAEQEAIREIWERVAEDYSPFDVDVTTEVPAAWDAHTTRVLITSKTSATETAMPYATTGGISYVNFFGTGEHLYYSPSFVYYDNLDNDPGKIGDASSHEFAHTLGLGHDGTAAGSGSEYYSGHGTGDTSWAPIMGRCYASNLSQWTKGEYTGANNYADELAVIAKKLEYRAETKALTRAAAQKLKPQSDNSGNLGATGVLLHSTDKHFYKFTAEDSATYTISANPYRAPSGTNGGNTDLVLELLDAAGNLIASADPAGGTDATLTETLTAGDTYYVTVSNIAATLGNPLASPPSGYTPYGCVGQYTLTTDIAPLAPAAAPAADLTAAWGGVAGGQTIAPTATAGVPLTLTATATSSDADITVVWKKNGTVITAGIVDTLSESDTHLQSVLTFTPLVADDGAVITVEFTSGAGVETETLTANISVLYLPVFPATPPEKTITVAAGTGTATIASGITQGNPPAALRWETCAAGADATDAANWTPLADGDGISGATTATLSLTRVTFADDDERLFRCVATSTLGGGTGIVSGITALDVAPVPVEIAWVGGTGGSSVAVTSGDTVTLEAGITAGDGPFTYEWLKNGEVIAGETGATLVFTCSFADDGAEYSVRVTGVSGDTDTLTTTLSVTPVTPVLTWYLGDGETFIVGDTVRLSVLASDGDGPFTYEWFKNGELLEDETSQTLTFYAAAVDNGAVFTVRVTGASGETVSLETTLDVELHPLETQPFPTVEIAAGDERGLSLNNYFADPDYALAVRLGFQTPTTTTATDGVYRQDVVDIQLLPTYSPLTVANFLKYVGLDDGTPKYVGTIIHRSSPSLGIVQGGGYRLNAAGTAYEHIGNYGTVVNEYDGTGDTPTNIRGTVAMAKRDNDPDSATSEWFVNLVDNSSTLGLSANGGYTVFGYITNQEGLDFFDYVNGLTTTDTQPTVAGYSPTVVYAERISELTFEVVENTAPELVTATISENLWLQLDANTDGAAGTARITLKATAPDGREVTQRLTVLVNGAVESETRFEVALSLPEAARPPAKSRLEQVFDALRGIKEDTAAATDVRSSYYDTDPESATYGTSIATAASVTADLTGVPADATYVWQKHSAGALYWSDIDGTAGTVGTATGADAAATFTVAAGEEYRLLVSDAAGDALGVAPVPSLNVLTGASLALTGVAWSSNGTAYVLLNGGKATFGVTGTGSGRIYYQWYFLPLDYTDDTYDWEPVTTGLGATITVTRAGYYFCYAVDRSGLLSQSDFVTVTTN